MSTKSKKNNIKSFGLLLLVIILITPWAAGANVGEISDEIKNRRSEINNLGKKSKIYTKKIKEATNKKHSLLNDIKVLDSQIKKSEVEILKTKKEMSLTGIELEMTKSLISSKQVEIKEETNSILNILNKIKIHDQQSYLEILLKYNTLTEFLTESKQLQSLQFSLKEILELLEIEEANLQASQLVLKSREEELVKLEEANEHQKSQLESQTTVKDSLLSKTKASEAEYKKLLANLKKEQANINNDIQSLEKKLRAELQKKSKKEALGYLVGQTFQWPVPKNVITTYFNDPGYPFRHIFEHSAIDIRAGQRTSVRAASSGYVARVRRDSACTGRYSFIMIIHADGLSTVYGHMNQITVNENQFVTQGQEIGRSGASPGTCGSGRLTTGPHMHFEIRKNGIPVNPLKYLP